ALQQGRPRGLALGERQDRHFLHALSVYVRRNVELRRQWDLLQRQQLADAQRHRQQHAVLLHVDRLLEGCASASPEGLSTGERNRSNVMTRGKGGERS